MNRYYRSRDGAWYTVIDREFKTQISQSRYREQADLVASALNQQESQNVIVKYTHTVVSATSDINPTDDSGILIDKCHHGTPFNMRCGRCESIYDKSESPPRR
jgi:NAD-dependent SIR2 family protein deacetylase